MTPSYTVLCHTSFEATRSCRCRHPLTRNSTARPHFAAPELQVVFGEVDAEGYCVAGGDLHGRGTGDHRRDFAARAAWRGEAGRVAGSAPARAGFAVWVVRAWGSGAGGRAEGTGTLPLPDRKSVV